MKVLLSVLSVFCCSIALGQINDFESTNFSRADSIAENYVSYPLMDLKTLAEKLTGSLTTDQEKFRAIYKWVCRNIEADYELVLLNKQNRAKLTGVELQQWNKAFNKIVFETLQQKRKTVCTGYAYLVRELAFHAGLQCEIVNGYARHAGINLNAIGQVNHSWNRILLNNQWYVCDATWSSGVFNLNTKSFVKRFDHSYFLMEPSLFYKTHYTMNNEVNLVDKSH